MRDKAIIKLTPIHESGRRSTFFKKISGIDSDVVQKRGMYGIVGEFLKAGDNLLYDGDIILRGDPINSVRHASHTYAFGMVLAGEISWIGTWTKDDRDNLNNTVYGKKKGGQLQLAMELERALESARLQFGE